MKTDDMTLEAADLESGMVDSDDDVSSGRDAVYEVGYHLVPSLSEDEVLSVASSLIEQLKTKAGAFVGERFPSKITLAYPMTKKIDEKNVRYDSAYFGWVAFELKTDTIGEIKTLFASHPKVLRFLIVRTSREGVAAAMTGAIVTPTGDIGKPKREAEAGGELSEKDLNEALQTIAAEDAKTSE